MLYRVWGHLPTIGRRVTAWSHHTGPLRPIGRHIVDAIDKLIIVGNPSKPEIVGGLTALAVAAAAYLLLAAAWSYWQRQDIKRFYRRYTPDDDTDPLGGREFLIFLSLLGFCGFLAIVIGVRQDYTLPWAWATTLNWYLLLVGAGLVGLPVALSALLRPTLRHWDARLIELFPRDGTPAAAEDVEAQAIPAS